MTLINALFTTLTTHPALLYSSVVMLGLIIGSFLNVVIYRLPHMMERVWAQDCAELMHTTALPPTESIPAPPFNLAYPPSHCPHCQHRIRSWENIPVLSYLLLRGRCTACHHPIGLRYPFIEIITALCSVVVIWQLGATSAGVFALVLTWGLITLAAIDIDRQLLPDVIVLPLLWLGLILGVFNVFVDSTAAIIGAAAGYMSLWSIFQLFRLVTGKHGMGYGDFKLFALFGAWFGWNALPQILLLSSVPGAVFGITLIALKRQQQQTPLPFGPFLAIAGWIYLLWGSHITTAYLQWSGLQ